MHDEPSCDVCMWWNRSDLFGLEQGLERVKSQQGALDSLQQIFASHLSTSSLMLEPGVFGEWRLITCYQLMRSILDWIQPTNAEQHAMHASFTSPYWFNWLLQVLPSQGPIHSSR